MKWVIVLWPSFIVAGLAEILFFTLISPQELYLLGEPVHVSAIASYSIGFLGFWAICAACSAATIFFLKPIIETYPQCDVIVHKDVARTS